MTNAAIQKEMAAMKADIRKLQKSVKVSAVVEKARAHLRAEILKGMASGPGKPINAGYWKRLHALAKRHARKA
jgi:hypothetical protein